MSDIRYNFSKDGALRSINGGRTWHKLERAQLDADWANLDPISPETKYPPNLRRGAVPGRGPIPKNPPRTSAPPGSGDRRCVTCKRIHNAARYDPLACAALKETFSPGDNTPPETETSDG